jgi:hypothetical protein
MHSTRETVVYKRAGRATTREDNEHTYRTAANITNFLSRPFSRLNGRQLEAASHAVIGNQPRDENRNASRGA